MSSRRARGGDAEAVAEERLGFGLEVGEVEVGTALLQGDHEFSGVSAEMDGADPMPWCKLGQKASLFPVDRRRWQLSTMKRTPVARRASARLRPAQRLGRSGDSPQGPGRFPGVALHHGCTPSVGQEGSSEGGHA